MSLQIKSITFHSVADNPAPIDNSLTTFDLVSIKEAPSLSTLQENYNAVQLKMQMDIHAKTIAVCRKHEGSDDDYQEEIDIDELVHNHLQVVEDVNNAIVTRWAQLEEIQKVAEREAFERHYNKTLPVWRRIQQKEIKAYNEGLVSENGKEE